MTYKTDREALLMQMAQSLVDQAAALRSSHEFEYILVTGPAEAILGVNVNLDNGRVKAGSCGPMHASVFYSKHEAEQFLAANNIVNGHDESARVMNRRRAITFGIANVANVLDVITKDKE